MNRNKGFTIMELLAVMGIIAILSAITFPAMRTIKTSANKNADMASMREIWSAIKLYKNDYGIFPESLAGSVQFEQKKGALKRSQKKLNTLHPRYIKSLQTFKPQPSKAELKTNNSNDIIPAKFPKKYQNQAFGNIDGFVIPFKLKTNTKILPTTKDDPTTMFYYKFSGYDAAQIPNQNSYHELRYTLFWSEKAIKENGSKNDDPRQLGYYNPPGDTIVTWNSYYRTYRKDNTPTSSSKDLVLFLDGSVKSVSSRTMAEKGWQYNPN